MKIAFIVEAFPVLSQTFILNQITGLIDRGHEVHVYAEFSEKTSKIHPDVEKYDLLKLVTYHPRLPQNKFVRAIQGLWLVLTSFPRNPLLVARSLNVFSYGKAAASLRLLFSIIPFLKKQPCYDIIQCHFGLLGIKGMFLKDTGAIKGKLITTFHGVDISQNLKLLGEDVYNSLFTQGDFFLPISQHWMNRLIELGCDSKKIEVHRMGIDCQKFTFIPRILDPEKSIRLISIARLTEKKGIEYGIRAVAIVLKHYTNVEYVIVGDGELRQNLAQLIQELDLETHVKLLGWRNQQEVVDLLNQSHILLAPSITAKDGNQEGIPVALMEAMAMGLPVLSTYHSGIPELVENGVCGFLSTERDVEALADRLNYLIQHPQSWVEMGRAGRLRVEEQFNINRLNDRLAAIYQQLLTPDPTPPQSELMDMNVAQPATLTNL
jgi:colanic acid/amylovoran biosynthesis glycosyltransferase